MSVEDHANICHVGFLLGEKEASWSSSVQLGAETVSNLEGNIEVYVVYPKKNN